MEPIQYWLVANCFCKKDRKGYRFDQLPELSNRNASEANLSKRNVMQKKRNENAPVHFFQKTAQKGLSFIDTTQTRQIL